MGLVGALCSVRYTCRLWVSKRLYLLEGERLLCAGAWMLALTIEIWGKHDPGTLFAFAGSQEGLGSPSLQPRFWVCFFVFCLDLLCLLLLCACTCVHVHVCIYMCACTCVLFCTCACGSQRPHGSQSLGAEVRSSFELPGVSS